MTNTQTKNKRDNKNLGCVIYTTIEHFRGYKPLFIVFMVLLTSHCWPSEGIVENYPFRALNNPPIKLEDDTIIVVCAPPRSGSTILYNIIKYLCEDISFSFNTKCRVYKYHDLRRLSTIKNRFSNEKKYIIFTSIREPLNIVASYKKLYRTKKVNINFKLRNPLTGLPTLRERYKIQTIATCKYEDFQNNQFDHILSKVNQVFGIKLTSDIRKLIFDYFSLDKMKEYLSEVGPTSSYCNKTTMLKNHINEANWLKDLSLEQAIWFYNKTRSLRKEWGYPDIDIDTEWKIFHETYTTSE